MNIKNYFLGICTLILTVLVIGCSKSTFEEQSLEDTTAYINLKVGNWKEYAYDTIVYKGFKRDTFSGYLRIETVDTFRNEVGDIVFKHMIYWKNDTSQQYTLWRVESSRFVNNELIESLDGLNFIKLKLPLTKKKSWNPHIYFTSKDPIVEVVKGEPLEIYDNRNDWLTEIIEKDVPVAIEGKTYEKNITCQLIKRSFTIDLKEGMEIHAPNVGMVYRKLDILYKDNSTNSTLYEDADKGFVMEMRLVDSN